MSQTKPRIVLLIQKNGSIEAFTSIRKLCNKYKSISEHTVYYNICTKQQDYERDGIRITRIDVN